jgi:phospholipase C
VAPKQFSDHPSAPWYGAWYLAESLNILTQNPEVWKKTIFVLTYDENDGYFDHVPPFVSPDPSRPETGRVSAGIDARAEYWPLEKDAKRTDRDDARGGPIGLGFRVPMVVASPWSRGGYVCSQVFDHTSVLQLLERVCKVKEPNISPWRRAVCGDMSAVFRPFQRDAEAKLPYPDRDEFLGEIHQAQFRPMPSGWEAATMPRQESGVRPSLALPYELSVEGQVQGGALRLRMAAGTKRFGAQSAGCGLLAYTPGAYRGSIERRARAYAVKAGETLDDHWELSGFPDGRYDLRVSGPNGFFRAFAGADTDPAVSIACVDTGSGVEVRVENSERSDLTVQIADRSYGRDPVAVTVRAGAERTVAFNLARSQRWYDFAVTVEGAGEYERRYAGRVENGAHGISDPVMA